MAAISGNRKSATFIDMTPMVDLAFLLLTFFVLTTNLTKPWVLKIEMPDQVKEISSKKLLEDERVLNLVLGDHDKIYWYVGMPGSQTEITDFSVRGIRKLIREKKVEIKNLYVLIKPSDQSKYQNVIDILDEMMIAEHTDYTLVDLEPEDKKLIGSN